MDPLFAFDRRPLRRDRHRCAGNLLLAFLAIVVAYLNWNGLVWWIAGIFVARARDWGRRGLWGALTVYLGLVDGWLTAELLKLVVQRPRPFTVVLDLPRPLIDEPTSFSFPSGDTAFAFGAAVALGRVAPAWRVPALLFAFAVAFERVAVGVHYPIDVTAGAIIGTISGLTAPLAVGLLRRRVRGRALYRRPAHALGSSSGTSVSRDIARDWCRWCRSSSTSSSGMMRSVRSRSTGHTIWAEDYLEKRPDDRSRIEALVRADRLLIGPWYVLADNLLVSGESLLRNFQEGLRVSGSFGRAMRVGYVADPVRPSRTDAADPPRFRISSYVFSRGVGDEGERVGAQFRWQAPSGDRVLATHLVDHYSGGLQLVGDLTETPPAAEREDCHRRRLGRMLDVTTAYANGTTRCSWSATSRRRVPAPARSCRCASPRRREHRRAHWEPRGIRGRDAPAAWRGRGRDGARQVAADPPRREFRACLDRTGERPVRAATPRALRAARRARRRDRARGGALALAHAPPEPSAQLHLRLFDRRRARRRHGPALRARPDGWRGARGAAGAWIRPGTATRRSCGVPSPWERDAVISLNDDPRACAVPRSARRRRSAPRVGLSSPEDGVIENEALRVEVTLDGSFFVIDRASSSRSGPHGALLDEGDRGDEYTYSYAGPTLGSRDVVGTRRSVVTGDRATVAVEFELRLPPVCVRTAWPAHPSSCRARCEAGTRSTPERVASMSASSWTTKRADHPAARAVRDRYPVTDTCRRGGLRLARARHARRGAPWLDRTTDGRARTARPRRGGRSDAWRRCRGRWAAPVRPCSRRSDEYADDVAQGRGLPVARRFSPNARGMPDPLWSRRALSASASARTATASCLSERR